MALRTYGDKPLSFQLEENGEFYYVGSEVNIFVFQYTGERCTNKKLFFSSRSETIYECFGVRCTKSIRE